jgi:hypothetical protein
VAGRPVEELAPHLPGVCPRASVHPFQTRKQRMPMHCVVRNERLDWIRAREKVMAIESNAV